MLVEDLLSKRLQDGDVIYVEGKSLTVLPALIDPHVHFRVPGSEHKEDWMTGARAAFQGGVTTVIDMPNNFPSCATLEFFEQKKALIQEQLNACGLPLRYGLYFGASKQHLKEIPKVRGLAAGIKVFMGSSTGDLLIDDDASLVEIFRMAADLDMLVSVHAEDEEVIRHNKLLFGHDTHFSVHSKIRDREAAIKAVSKAIGWSKKIRTRLCILHVTTKEEIELIGQAKQEGVPVYAEVAPHHLLLHVRDYDKWGSWVQVNPPLRDLDDLDALWKGIEEGVVDTIGTDHAPHTKKEKELPYGKAPSGIPSIDLLLPLLLNAVHEKKMTLQTLIKLTRTNPEKIFRLQPNQDKVLVDLNEERFVEDEDLETKCGWSPYKGRNLRGWPAYTIAQGKIFIPQKEAKSKLEITSVS